MNTKQSICMICKSGVLVLFVLIIAGCGLWQPPAPTVTPIPTDTNTPVPTATSTVAPTLTPTLQPEVQGKLIMEIEPELGLEFLITNLVISPDLQYAAYIVQENGLYVPIVNGEH